MCPLRSAGGWAHLGTTTGSRLCPKDQPQQVRMPRVAELSENAWPRRAAAAGAPHTAAVRSRAFGGGRCARVAARLGNLVARQGAALSNCLPVKAAECTT